MGPVGGNSAWIEAAGSSFNVRSSVPIIAAHLVASPMDRNPLSVEPKASLPAQSAKGWVCESRSAGI